MASAPRWIVELRGHPFDLEDLPDLLHGSPLAVEKHGNGWILSPELFAGMTDANTVREEANSLVLFINGIRQCTVPGVGPINVAGVALEGADGKRHIFEFVEVRATAHAHAKLGVIRNGQQVLDDDAGGWRRLAVLSRSDDEVAKVFRLMAKQPITVEGLFKVFEIVVETSGGMGRVEEMGWATKTEMESFTGTMNHPDASGDDARHGIQKGRYKRKPMEIGTAVALILRLVNRWLNSRIEAKHVTGRSSSDDATQ